MKMEEIEGIISDNYYWVEGSFELDLVKAVQEIYKLHLQEKLKLIENFRTQCIANLQIESADEYFEVAEELTKELKKLE